MLKIKKIEVIKANIPRKTPFEIARGTLVVATRVFVRITLEDGSVGYGECAVHVGTGDRGAVAIYSEETQSTCYTIITEQIAPALLGVDAVNMADVHSVISAVTLMNPQAKAGVDMAIYDAVGKALKVPVYALLGGAYRKEIPLAMSVGVKTDAEVIDGAKKVIGDGFRVIKLKGGRDIKDDIKRLELIRKAVGDYPVRLDANAGYPAYDRAILPLTRAQELGLDELEQPLGRFDWRGMQRLTSELTTPIIADETVFFPPDAAYCIQTGAADVINIKVQKAGGLFHAIRIDHVAQASKVGVLVGALQETGIGTAASMHLAAACKLLSCASDCRAHLSLEHTLLRNTLQMKDGIARVPEEPGLGVEVDEEALARYAVQGWESIAA